MGKCTVINGKVYYGGGSSFTNSDQYIVCCYHPSEDSWSTLPPLPVGRFGLGQVSGQLVAVGGRKKSDTEQNKNVYTFDERSKKKWENTIPSMLTARTSPNVLSVQSALLVAGGVSSSGVYKPVVEIFKPDTSQWYTTDSLPIACQEISLAVVGNTCYALGRYKHPSYLNQALYASVDDLLRNARPADQATPSHTRSAWKTLPDTPTYGPTATVLAGQLFAVGGYTTSEGGASRTEIYMYSSSTDTWIYVSDLPALHSSSAVAVLSPAEILVIGGGCSSHDSVNTVYKGTLQLKL